MSDNLLNTEMRARSVRYDKQTNAIAVEFLNGCTFTFPPSLVQSLRNTATDDLANVQLASGGYGLHWPSLDEDLSIAGLIAGRFQASARK